MEKMYKSTRGKQKRIDVYDALLQGIASDGGLLVPDFAIEKLDDASMLSAVFIIWVILLALPLFSELEFLGVKVKKEVKKAVEKKQ